MKITYTPNPLATVVELEPHEAELLKLKLRLERYEDMMFMAHHELTSRLDTEQAVALAIKQIDPNKWGGDMPNRFEQHLNEVFQCYINDLADQHAGDCTAFAASCTKCHAEDLLGINTLGKYPGKHALHAVAGAFSNYNPDTKKFDRPEPTLDEAIAKLSQRTDDGAKTAVEYLTQHRNTHFKEN